MIFRKFFTKQNIVKASLFVAFFNISLRFLSLINSSILASKFGTSQQLDIFLATQSIIDLIVAFFSITIGITFIPIFLDLKKVNKKKAYNLFNSLLSAELIISLIISIIIFAFSSNIIVLLFGFSGNNLVLSVNILRILSITITPFILTSLIQNFLFSHKQFVVPITINILFSIINIMIIILLFSNFDSSLKT